MSEGDVSLIQDEDVLRRMWQQTEDFGKKKEIRAHMYKLREERLKNLYGNAEIGSSDSLTTLETTVQDKGSRPTPHSDSFADQCFQSLKTKEIRDSESPTKDMNFGYTDDEKRDAKWTVVSKEHISDDGNVKAQSTIAHASGSKEIEGGTASFTAIKEDGNIVKQHEDDHSKSLSTEKQTKSMTAEQSLSETKDGAITTSKTSSVTSSTTKNISHSVHSDSDHPVAYNESDENNKTFGQQSVNQSMRSVTETRTKVSGEEMAHLMKDSKLVSREVSHPDARTTIITETRELPDGTICTSTKKEIRGTSEIMSTGKEIRGSSENINTRQTSQRVDSKHSETSKSRKVVQNENTSQKEIISQSQNISSKFENPQNVITKEIISESQNISSKIENPQNVITHTTNDDDSMSVVSESSVTSSKIDALEAKKSVSHDTTNVSQSETKEHYVTADNTSTNHRVDEVVVEKDIQPVITSNLEANVEKQEVNETFVKKNITELCAAKTDDGRPSNVCYPKNQSSLGTDNKTTGEYITTYQTDYTDKKISQDFSPTHVAWASSLRSSTDNPLRAGSPMRSSNRSLKSSASSLRSSTSPDKRTYERSPSPKKINVSPERWSPTTGKPVSGKRVDKPRKSPEKTYSKTTNYSKTSTDDIKQHYYSPQPNRKYDSYSPRYASPDVSPTRLSPDKSSVSPSRNSPSTYYKQTDEFKTRELRSPIRDYSPEHSPTRSSPSPTRYTKNTTMSIDSSPTTSVSEIEFMKPNKYKHDSDGVNIQSRDSNTIDSSTLTRKSSLKKTSDKSNIETLDYTSDTHKIVKKDSADSADKVKEKPPFVRSETYEERCRKILGMPDKKTLVEDAEKNLTNILNILPTEDKRSYSRSPERELSAGLKSAEFTDGSAPRKSSLKKTNDRQYLNTDNAEFISFNKDGSVVSSNKKIDSYDFLERERVTEEKNKDIKKTVIDNKENYGKSRENSPTKHKSPRSSTETSPVRKSILSSSENTTTNTFSKNVVENNKRTSSRTPSPDKRSPTRNKTDALYNENKNIINTSSTTKKNTTQDNIVRKVSRTPSPEKSSPVRSKPSTIIKNVVTSTTVTSTKNANTVSKGSRTPSPEKRSPTRYKTEKVSDKVTKHVSIDKTYQTRSSNEQKSISTNISSKTVRQREPSPDKKNLIKKQSPPKDDKRHASPTKKPIDQIRKTSPEKHAAKPKESPERPQSKSSSPENKRVNIYKAAVNKTTSTITQRKIEPTRTILTTTKYDIFKSDKTSPEKKSPVSIRKQTSPEKKPIQTNITKDKTETEQYKKTQIKNTIDLQRRNTDDLKLKDIKSVKTTDNKFSRTGSDTMLKTNENKTTYTTTNKTVTNNKTTEKIGKIGVDKYLTTRRDSDVFINEEHAKSSHETSPERIWPTPIKTDTDIGKPRYPDKVTEPDDHQNSFKRKSIKEIISENETETTGNIIEISDDETETTIKTNYKVYGSDECLLSVPEKVTKFLNTDDSTYLKTKKVDKSEPTRKTASDKVEKELDADDCLLSVSDKVSKFTNVSDKKQVDKTSITKEFLRQEISENLKGDECLLSVNDKVSKFLSTAEKITEPIKISEPSQKAKRPDLTMVEENLKTNQRNLSVSDKVTKFINTAEKVVNPVKSPESVPKTSKIIDNVKTKFESNGNDLHLNIQRDTVASQMRRSSEDKFVKTTFTDKVQSKTPEKKPIAGPVTIMRSSEAVKKAKAVFENKSNVDNVSSEEAHRKATKLTDIGVYKKSSTVESVPDVVPKIDTMIDTESETEQEAKFRKTSQTKKDVSPTRVTSSTYCTKTTRKSETIKDTSNNKNVSESSGDILISRRGSGKFGVELRKTPIEQSPVKKPSRPLDSHTPIENIQDLSLLEEMLEKVTGYEQRRRIRAQFRLLKKNLENLEKSEEHFSSSKKTSVHTESKETRFENKKSVDSQEISFRSVSPLRKSVDHTPKSPQSKSSSRSTSPSKSTRGSNNTSPERKSSFFNEKKTYNVLETKKEHVSRIQKNKITDNEPAERKPSPDKYANFSAPRVSKVSEYTEAYLRRISASNNLKPEALPKVISPKRDKEEHLFAEYETSHSRKSSMTNQQEYSTTTSKTESTTRVRNQSPPKYTLYRTPSPEIISHRNEYEAAFKNFKSKTPNRDSASNMNNRQQTGDNKPEWVTNNILKKSSENRTQSTKKSEQKKSSKQILTTSIGKDADPVISSYGVGPRDENGLPLFGIKALRKQSNSSPKYEIKGSLVHKEYTIENGGEPRGHITTTEYSTNSSDLDKFIAEKTQDDYQDVKKRGSVTSVTTTTKFGGSPGNTLSQIHRLQSIPKTADHGVRLEQPKTVRRGSVKTLTEKFTKNSIESSKHEKPSYPKAGLILRSTLRDNASGSASSRSSTPGIARTDSNASVSSAEGTSTTVEQHFQQKTSTGSFLDNNVKVTGVKDIITRMKNADIVLDENETNDDAEARALLNKFLGATVLMSGMEGYVNRPQESKTVTVTKTTKVYSNIDDIWDERILKKLLEESDDYEERRRLRARLRQVMAEQEACAQIVAEAAEAGAGGDCSIEETSTHSKGELKDTIDQVHGVLTKLQDAIAAGEDRDRLLELVARLQEDIDGTQGRKASRYYRRRNKKNRHTVGVTKEELDDARKFIENLTFPLHGRNDDLYKDLSESLPRVLQKQSSLGTLLPMQYTNNSSIPQSPVKNSTPQPFSKNNDGFVYPEPITSPRQEIVNHNGTPIYRKPMQHQTSVDASTFHTNSAYKRPVLQESISLDSGVEVSPKPLSKLPMNHSEPDDLSEEELNKTTTKPIIMNGIKSPNTPKQHIVANKYTSPNIAHYNQNGSISATKFNSGYNENINAIVDNNNFTAKPSQNRFINKKIKMKRANTIDIPKPLHHYQIESDEDENMLTNGKPKLPQFTPKTDNDKKFLAFIQKHNNKDPGPIWSQTNLNGPNKAGCNWRSCFGSIKNVFEGTNSETPSHFSNMASAKKFWKNSDDSINVAKPVHHSFTSKFTRTPITNNFNQTHPHSQSFTKASPSVNSFAKTPPANTNVSNYNKNNHRTSPIKSWTTDIKDDVITASLTVPGIPIITNTAPSKVIKPIPKPLPVNQFSHAPMSAFKPLPKKSSFGGAEPQIWSPPSLNTKYKDSERYDKIFSDKSNFVTSKPPMQKSPVNSCPPWALNNTSKESRVMNLATSKFEKSVQNDPQPVKNIPQYREKSNVMKNDADSYPSKRYSLPQALPPSGALSAPHLVKKLENLKNHFDNDHIPITELPSKIDTERLQIEFYEKQIREKSKKNAIPVNGIPARRFSEQIPSPDYTYTVTDYSSPTISTFVPMPQIPDIEEVKPTPAKKLPDLVLNNVTKPLHTLKSHISSSLENLSNINKKKSPNEFIEDYQPDINGNEEFKAVSKVMRGPVSQQAVLKPKNTQETYEKRDTAAKSLKGVLQKFSTPKHDVITQIEKKKAAKAEGQPDAEAEISKKGQKDCFKSKPSFNSALQNNSPNPGFQVYNPKNDNNARIGNTVIPKLKCNNVSLESKFVNSLKYPPSPDASQVVSPRTMFTQSAYKSDSYASNDHRDPILRSKLHSPINKANAGVSPTSSPEYCHVPSPYALSKSESWHQFIQQTASKPPSPRISPGNKIVTRAKSMHFLSVPKQFEAGISKDKVHEKKKTVEAYFSGQVSPNPLSKSSSQSAVNETLQKSSCETFKSSSRTKRSVAPSYALGRSRTMPHINMAELALLDEDNVEDAFDDLFNEA